MKGGEPDFNNVARMVLHDWQRGRLPWFCRPSFEDELTADSKGNKTNDELSLKVLQMVDRIPAGAEFEVDDLKAEGGADDVARQMVASGGSPASQLALPRPEMPTKRKYGVTLTVDDDNNDDVTDEGPPKKSKLSSSS